MTQQTRSLCSKSQVSISIPKRQIDYLSAMETVYEGSHPSLQSTDLRVKPLKRRSRVTTFIKERNQKLS